jgi:hypothetical protein
MRVELQVVGGIAALNIGGAGLRSSSWVVDSDDLPEPEAGVLRALVSAARAAPPPPRARPDAGSHRITVTDRGQMTSLVGSDGAMPPEMAQLVSWIRKRASAAKPTAR